MKISSRQYSSRNQIQDILRDFWNYFELDTLDSKFPGEDFNSIQMSILEFAFISFANNATKDQLNDRAQEFATLVNGVDSDVPATSQFGTLAIACAFDPLSLVRWKTGNYTKQEIVQECFSRGPGAVGLAELGSGNTDMTTSADGTVSSTYTRANPASSGILYYNRGDGYLETVGANAEYVHSKYGMYFEYPITNYVTYSCDFTNAAWSPNARLSVSADQTNEPRATPTGEADALLDSGTAGTKIFARTGISGAAGDNTYSIHVKPIKNQKDIWIRLWEDTDPANYVDCYFHMYGGGDTSNLASGGTFSNEDAEIEELVDGWYRISVTADSAAVTSFNVDLHFLDSDLNTSFTGEAGDGLYIWGSQLEEGPGFPTSFLRTVATTQARSASSLNYAITAYDIIPSPTSDYNVTVEAISKPGRDSLGTFGRVYQVAGETSRFLSINRSVGQMVFRHGTVNSIISPFNLEVMQKFSCAYTHGTTTSELHVNGESQATQNSHDAVSGTGTSIYVGSRNGSADLWSGFIRKICFGNLALSS